MTFGAFGMDKYMPDWTEDFDFGAFLNFPPDDVDQGGEDGGSSQTHLDPDNLKLSPPACAFGGSSQVSDLMPKVCDERRTNVLGLSYTSALPGSFGSSKAPQSTDTYPGINNVPPTIGYEADNLYGDAAGATADSRPAYATVMKTSVAETIATGELGEACTVASAQEPPRPSSSVLPNGSNFRKDCTCIRCSGIATTLHLTHFGRQDFRCRFPSCQYTCENESYGKNHERSHYGLPGKYRCIEQNCPVVTKNFGDLKRHDKAKHCTNPNKEQYPCTVLWCKYSGSNGFARKDKLKSHYRNIHEGKCAPAKAGRVIKPATLRPKVSGLESSAGKQKE